MPNASQINTEPAWLVLRYVPDMDRMWQEVGCVNMEEPMAAFRHVVFGTAHEGARCARPPEPGEYRIVRLDGTPHIAVEINLRDLDAKA